MKTPNFPFAVLTTEAHDKLINQAASEPSIASQFKARMTEWMDLPWDTDTTDQISSDMRDFC
jgi:hypothetical protein